MDGLFDASKTAVITGAAMGIGRATVLLFARQGMNVCLLDVLEDELGEAVAAAGAEHPEGMEGIYSAILDVSDEAAWAKVRDEILERFGSVHFLMNNAASRGGAGWAASPEEWRQAFDVNFWGVVNGVNAFLPSMLENGGQGIIVNTGSKQGITNPPGHPIYNISKSALKTYTEPLQHDLRNRDGCQVSAHLLVPGWTTTGKREHKPGAWLPEQVVERMISALENRDFYVICPDDEVTEEMDRKRTLWGAQDITENRPPLSRWHPDWADAAKKACE